MFYRVCLLHCLFAMSTVHLFAAKAETMAKHVRKLDTGKKHHDYKKEKEEKVDKAIWSGIKDPEDIFSRFSPVFMKKVKARYTPAELLNYIRKISKKLYYGDKLRPLERLAWKSAANALRMELKTSNCDLFFSSQMREWGICCRVMAAGEFFGFCTLLRLLHIKKNHMKELLASKVHLKQRVVRNLNQLKGKEKWREMNSSGRWPQKLTPLLRQWLGRFMLRRYGYYMSLSPYQTYYNSHEDHDEESDEDFDVYIDLFAVPCNPPLDLSLCSQFCCSPDHYGSIFCNSNLECY